MVTKISELNYEKAGQKDKKQIVHVNRLKAAHDPSVWKPKLRHKTQSKPFGKPVKIREEGQEKI